jgi:SAM-dependent methyltransferase
MAQYQSFPGVTGDSSSLEKLEALRLPSMRGKRFLDVGCNEGFFCGYALWQGAARSVGIDRSSAVIAKARQRFPGCEFLHQGWDTLPQGPFDVILLASSLHYADDQAALVHALANHLAPDGLLVLELGMHPSAKNEWVLVKRGIDERTFPSRKKLIEVLQNYAWKFIGRSVSQAGDPVGRVVVHVTPRKRMAYLLMQPPGYGKSTIARSLFEAAGVRVVTADVIINQVATGRLSADAALQSVIKENFSHLHVDQTTQRILKAGLLHRYVELMLQHAGTTDFALDAYLPALHHSAVIQLLAEKGYMPVQLTWERAGVPFASVKDAKDRAQSYFASLTKIEQRPEIRPSEHPLPFQGTHAIVDAITSNDGQVTVRGWALNDTGVPPSILVVDVAGTRHIFDKYVLRPRHDVQKHFSLSHKMCGYQLSISLEDASEGANLKEKICLFAGDSLEKLSGPFRG